MQRKKGLELMAKIERNFIHLLEAPLNFRLEFRQFRPPLPYVSGPFLKAILSMTALGAEPTTLRVWNVSLQFTT